MSSPERPGSRGADEQWRAVERAFAAARALPPESRAEWLEEHCPDGHRAEVEALLEHDASGFLGTPLLGDDPDQIAETLLDAADSDGAAPERIAGYRLLRVLARGGMGVVYVAEQDDPRRLVALKLLRIALADDEGRARFRREAAILARLEHEGIARVHEAGLWQSPGDTTGEGLPWIAMELFEGALSITDYAAAHSLTTRERVALIAELCDAVHFGHLRGIVHRDLKPANLLVDASGRGKVIDFGVARASDPELMLDSLATLPGALVGTLRYMSPEQCDAGSEAVDVRSDVYSLGVVLFELLAERAPYELPTTSLAAAVLALREQEAPSLASRDPRFAGDLDVIVGKALARERAERYASAGDLARDLRHFLDYEPIEARPPSALYLFSKWIRRRRAAAAAAGALVVGSAVALIALVQALDAEGRARQAQRDEQDQRREAERQRDEAEAVTTFLEHTLQRADPRQLGQDVPLSTVLRGTTDELDGAFPDAPHIEARLAQTLGITWFAIGREPEAEALLRRGLALRETELGPTHPDTSALQVHLSIVLAARAARAEARALLEDAVGLLEPHVATHARELVLALTYLATIEREELAFDKALALVERAHVILGRDLAHDRQLRVNVLTMEFRVRIALGECERALAVAEETLEYSWSSTPSGSQDHALALGMLSSAYMCLGRLDLAESRRWETLEMLVPIVGREHDLYVTTLEALVTIVEARDMEESLSLAREALAIRRRIHDSSHPDLVYSAFLQARRLARSRHPEEAVELYSEALAGLAGLHPQPIDETAVMLGERGDVRRAMGRYDDAEGDLLSALEIFESVVGLEDRRAQVTIEMLVTCYRAMGRDVEAREWQALLN